MTLSPMTKVVVGMPILSLLNSLRTSSVALSYSMIFAFILCLAAGRVSQFPKYAAAGGLLILVCHTIYDRTVTGWWTGYTFFREAVMATAIYILGYIGLMLLALKYLPTSVTFLPLLALVIVVRIFAKYAGDGCELVGAYYRPAIRELKGNPPESGCSCVRCGAQIQVPIIQPKS